MTKQIDLKFSIGQRIRDYRVKNHYTQAQFAELIDISINFLSGIENGKKGMSQETICKLCEQFNLSADYLLFGKEEQPDSFHSLLSSQFDTSATSQDMQKSPRSHSAQLIMLANELSPEDLQLLIDYLIALLHLKKAL